MEHMSNAYANARKKRGLSIAAAAASLGVPEDELVRCERGELIPDAVEVLHMARLYGTSADYLIGNCADDGLR